MVGPEWAGLVSLPAVVCGRSIATPADCRMGRRVLRRLSAFVLFRRPDACGRYRADYRRPVAMMIHVIDRVPVVYVLLRARPARAIGFKLLTPVPYRIRPCHNLYEYARSAGGMKSPSIGSPSGAPIQVFSDSLVGNMAS